MTKFEMGLPAYEFVAVDEALWLASVALDWPHPDRCDRMIVATALRLRVPIATADMMIRSI